jgi:photosystem II stability/assembly factor-like uncharacterized protein
MGMNLKMRAGGSWVIAGVLVLLTPAAGRLIELSTRLSAQTSGDAATARVDPAAFSGLKFRSIGPANTGGRVDDFAVARVPGAPDAIYVGTASGGIFKSTNQGTSWVPIFDGVDAMMSIGDLAVSPSNPNIVWAGTGEANNRQSSSWGDGVYKSMDSGRTWNHMGLKESRHVGRIVIHPTNPDIVYVASVGHMWGSNPERGVFKTTDGGQNWKKVLFVDNNTGATDIVLDPVDPNTLFAATYQRQRKAWGFNGGGPGSGIYRSYDAGATWTKLAGGLPAGDQGRIGLDIFQRDGRIVYAVVEAGGRGGGRGAGGGEGAVTSPEGGVYRSTDRGDSWERLTSLNPRPSYYSQIRIDPKDRSRIYLLGSNRGFYISDDGGRNFRDVFSTIHSEDHALWVDPDDPNHLIVGGDGGVSISWDRGATWMFRDNLPIGQFYEIGVDMKDPYTVCGGLQDNGHWCVPSATRNRNGISNQEGFNIGSGDGFYARMDPSDPQTVFIESQGGRANRVNLTTLEHQAIAPVGTEKPPARGGGEESDAGLRWNWDTPMTMSSGDPAVLYMGANRVFRSGDRGVTWKAISPDLTAAIDRTKLEMMGQRLTDRTLSRNDGQSNYGTLTTIGESPLDRNVLYTGSDDGQLQMTRDGGAHWANITSKVPGLPANTYVSSVQPSRFVAGRVYATFDGHFNDDYHPYVFVSEDYGQRWKAIAAGLPETGTHRLREDLKNPRLLFLGHEKGLHLSLDGGASWVAMNVGMPRVPVDDLLIHPRTHDLVIGTHGRSIWIVDDIGPLEALTPEVLTSAAALLPSSRAQLLRIYNPQAWYGAGQYFAPNPEFGGVVTYYLKDSIPGGVEIDIMDAAGASVRGLHGPGTRGLNRLTWDLRMEPPVKEERESPGVGGFGGAPSGPEVLPGKYKIALKAPGSAPASGEITVEGDPRTPFDDADRRTRQTSLLALYDLERALGAARSSARTLTAQLAAIRRDLAPVGAGRRGGPGNETSAALDKVAAAVSQVQGDAERQLNGASQLARAVEGYSGVPTEDQRRGVDWAYEDATAAIKILNRLLETDAPALYTQLTQQQAWPKHLPPIALPARRPAAQ